MPAFFPSFLPSFLSSPEFTNALISPFLSYINKTDSAVTSAWLKEGAYELEVMGKRFPATLHLRTPFDPKNKRLQGDYSEQKQR